jgi:hypothetical protein
MKSPILLKASWPIKRIDRYLYDRYAAEKAEYDALSKEEKKLAEPPQQTRIRIEDTTIEAAQEVLRDSPDGVLCLQDELSGFFGMMDRYAGGRSGSKDRAFWLQSWNGGEYVFNRIARGVALIPNLSVSLLGGIQPDLIRKLSENTVDDGLMQRGCPIVLKPATAGRDEPRQPSSYGDLINELHTLKEPTPENYYLPVTTLYFDDEAQQVQYALEKKHLDLQNLEGVNKKLASHIGKYNGIFARLCVIWHCVENSKGSLPAVVTGDTARQVAKFMDQFLLPHAVSFYAGTLNLSDDHDQLTAVANHILIHQLKKLTNRDVQRGSRTMRKMTKKDVEKIFEQLEIFGWIGRSTEVVPGQRPSDPPKWDVNPQVHTLFRERAEREAARLSEMQKIVAEVFKNP